jgi:hypothetical protein
MCCAWSYFHQMHSFYLYSKQTLYFYSLIQMVYIEDKKNPLSSICWVSKLIIFPTLLRMPVYQFTFPSAEWETKQKRLDWCGHAGMCIPQQSHSSRIC